VASLGTWTVVATSVMSRLVAFRRQPFQPPSGVVDTRYQTAQMTVAVAVVVATAIWTVAVWVWTWHRRSSARPAGLGRYIGLFLILGAALFAVTPFTSEGVLSCPGPLPAKIEELTHPDWELICGYNSTLRIVGAAAVLAIGLAILLRTVLGGTR